MSKIETVSPALSTLRVDLMKKEGNTTMKYKATRQNPPATSSFYPWIVTDITIPVNAAGYLNVICKCESEAQAAKIATALNDGDFNAGAKNES